MEKLPPKQKKLKGASRDELLKLSKEELVDKVIKLEAHNNQLKNIISKKISEGSAVANLPGKNQKQFDYSKYHSRTVLLHILYFGWDYNGYVVQEDTWNTIEHHLFNALTRTCLIESRETSNYHRCGRTDKGVSAFGQVISISLRSKHAPDVQNSPESLCTELDYCTRMNRVLPKDIRVVRWMPVPEGFSARFDCKKRQYKYYFPKSSLNIDAMKQACKMLVGSHDFRNLCKMDVGNGVTEFIRNILNADILAVDDNDALNPTSMYYLLIEGNAFLWHQIRCIQAILLLVGGGHESADVVERLLDCENNNRKPQYNMAIDVPLNLFKCSYDVEDNNWVYDEDELSKLITHVQGEWTIQNIKATMLKDCLQSLEDEYTKKKETEGSEDKQIIAYHDCLTEGVKPKNYKPLMKRPTCSTLEERIEHYKKRRKQYGPETTAVENAE